MVRAGVPVVRWTGREARALREAQRLSVRDFAARLGVGDASVSKWEGRGELARLRTGSLTVVADAEVTSHVALLAAVPDDVRHAFAARVLDPVLDYDARNSAGLYLTLEAFLDCSGSWSKAAARLHLHINTVRYRIGRVEELTGRDLTRFEDRVDLFLALRSR